MDLGMFSISLAVDDLKASRDFYEKLGFELVGGDEDEDWLVLQNGNAMIGLFHGMFDGNLFTFHPPDVRAVRDSLGTHGIDLELDEEGAASDDGPAHGILTDPDGNRILLDQF